MPVPAQGQCFKGGAVVDVVKVLVTALLVQRVAIGAVGEGGAFVEDRFGKDPVCGVGKGLSLAPGHGIAATLRVDAGHVQDLRRVKIADPRDGTLIE